jgi:hypothetical protein
MELSKDDMDSDKDDFGGDTRAGKFLLQDEGDASDMRYGNEQARIRLDEENICSRTKTMTVSTT